MIKTTNEIYPGRLAYIKDLFSSNSEVLDFASSEYSNWSLEKWAPFMFCMQNMMRVVYLLVLTDQKIQTRGDIQLVVYHRKNTLEVPLAYGPSFNGTEVSSWWTIAILVSGWFHPCIWCINTAFADARNKNHMIMHTNRCMRAIVLFSTIYVYHLKIKMR